ncbi:MAG: signal peptidase II [Chloroflexota bacterium]
MTGDSSGGDDLDQAHIGAAAGSPGITPSGAAAERPNERPVVAARGRARWFLFLGLAGAIVLVDQLTKAWLVGRVAPGEVVRVLGDYIRLVDSQNSGALFGLFHDQAVLFGLASLAVIGLIVAYHGRSGRNTYLSIALGLLLGGAIGNLLDRLRLGYVVDFVDIGIGDLRWYTFNVADSAISLAIVLLVLLAVFPSLGPADSPPDG